jgi:hypothetical protein
VQLEGKMPANTKVVETQGRAAGSEGTLWDQEAHENSIRILVEEAKVNLCLRMMNDFKKWQYSAQYEATINQTLQTHDYNRVQLEQKCQQFEDSLGLLLWRSFMHVETLQLMDIPLLIDHISEVLTKSCEPGFDHGGKAKMQEHVVLRFFSSLMKHAENLNNGELLAKTRERNMVMMVTYMMISPPGNVNDVYASDIIAAVAEGFAALADNEDFQPQWQTFFGVGGDPAGDIGQFKQLEDKIVNPIIQENPARKKDLRPLLDLFNKMKRTS